MFRTIHCYVGMAALLVALLGATSCASRRAPPPYVYVPPAQEETVVAPRPAPAPAQPRVQTERPQAAPRPTDTQAAARPRPASPAPAEPRVTPVAQAERPRPATAPTATVTEATAARPTVRRPDATTAAAPQTPAAPAVSPRDRAIPTAPPVQPMDAFASPEAAQMSVAYRLQISDPIVVHLRGIPEAAYYEYVINDTGLITLPYLPPIRAVGLTAAELQQAIHDKYIEERIYRQITVNVILPTQSYFVHGEVRQPGRFPLTSGLTVLKAIAAAGGYTEFANPRRVEINRAGETTTVNARQLEQRPDRDIEIKVNDVITVRRSVF